MTIPELINQVSLGPNSGIIAGLGSDPSWTVLSDWGFEDWHATRVPAGIKFERSTNGLISEGVMVVRGGEEEEAKHRSLLQKARIPIQLVALRGPHHGTNRLNAHQVFPHEG